MNLQPSAIPPGHASEDPDSEQPATEQHTGKQPTNKPVDKQPAGEQPASTKKVLEQSAHAHPLQDHVPRNDQGVSFGAHIITFN